MIAIVLCYGKTKWCEKMKKKEEECAFSVGLRRGESLMQATGNWKIDFYRKKRNF